MTDQVDALFAEWDKPDSPGCALAIIQDSEIIYQRSYGCADLEHDIPITPMSVFDIASTSKQFTATCIAILARQGKLSLDDEAEKHIPELPGYAHPITIRHLIHHTSGIRDYLTLMELAGMRYENEYPDEEVLDLICRQKELNFEPGEEYLYSNTGYLLLGEIVKRVSGKTLRTFADEGIFAPLGMKKTHFHDDFTEIVKDRAVGYSAKEDGGFRIDMSIFDVVGDGCVYTTVEDLYLWDQNFYHNSLGNYGHDLIAEISTPGRLNNGEKLNYAFGLVVEKYRGLDLLSHGGDWAGYRSELIRFPGQKFSVICLANLGEINPTRLAKQIAEIYLEKEFTEPAAEKREPDEGEISELPAMDISADQLQEYAGEYDCEELGVPYKLVFEEGRLILVYKDFRGEILKPMMKDSFKGAEITLRFTRDNQNQISGFQLDAGRVKNLQFVSSHSVPFQTILEPSEKSILANKGLSGEEFWKAVEQDSE